jgi:hypothetical protein
MDGSVDSFAHRTKEIMSSDCYACRLTEGVEPLPGGRIFATQHWVVDHCTGPLRVGTLTSSPSPLSPCRRSHRSGSSGSWSPRATGIPHRTSAHPSRPGVRLLVVSCRMAARAHSFRRPAGLERVAWSVWPSWPLCAGGYVSNRKCAAGRGCREDLRSSKEATAIASLRSPLPSLAPGPAEG